ncbi:MAG: hypothetical protein HY878_02090 [Deltaproteobacteria bacterium]|nr:hypothetical protein [Deltaproteobacteria bacterium]
MPFLITVITALFLLANGATAGWDHIGPHGGLISVVVEDKAGNIYIGTEGSGVFKSSDGGEAWVSASSGLHNPFVSTMAVTKDEILAGTRGGLFKSGDMGRNWQLVTTLPPGLLVSYIMVDKNGTIYVAIWGSGVYKSKDGGATWEVLKENLSSPFVNSIAIDSSGDLYAATEGGVFKSKGGGPDWVQVGLIENIVTALVIDEKGAIYAGTWRDGAFKSKDGGATWDNIGKGLNPYIKTFFVGRDGVIYAGAEEGVFSLQPGATSWKSIGLSGVLIRSVVVIGGKVYAGSHGKGLYINSSGVWTQENVGITNYEVLSIAIDSDGRLYAGTSWGLFKLVPAIFKQGRDKGGRWEEIEEHAGRRIQVVFIDNTNIYVGTPSGLFNAPSRGRGWTRVKGGVGVLNITTIIKDGRGNLYVGTDGEGVFMSKGDSWKPLNEGLTSQRVSSLVMDTDGNIYAGTYSGVFKLTGDRARWGEAGMKGMVVQSLTITKDGNLYAGTDGHGVFILGKDGWRVINEGLKDMRVFSVAADSKGNLYAGTRQGIFFKKGDGAIWEDISSGLINVTVQTVMVAKDDKVYIGTWGAGVCRRR